MGRSSGDVPCTGKHTVAIALVLKMFEKVRYFMENHMPGSVNPTSGRQTSPQAVGSQGQASSVSKPDGKTDLPKLYKNMMYTGVAKLNQVQQRNIDRILEVNAAVNRRLDNSEKASSLYLTTELPEEVKEDLLYQGVSNRQLIERAFIDAETFLTSGELKGLFLESEVALLEEELEIKNSPRFDEELFDFNAIYEDDDEGHTSSAAKPSMPPDEHFQKVSALLRVEVTADNVVPRQVTDEEIRTLAERKNTNDVKILEARSMKSDYVKPLLEQLAKDEYNGKTIIVPLYDDGHFVTLAARNGELCVFDSLPPVKDPNVKPERNPKSSGESAVKLILNILHRNEDLMFDPDKIGLVERRLQEQKDENPQNRCLENSCGLFPFWLQEYASKDGIKDQPLVTTVTGFADEIGTMSKAEKDTMNLKTRFEMLEAVRESAK